MLNAIALHAAAKLLRVNPFGDLGENRLSSAHFGSLALSLLRKNAKATPYRSHHKNTESPLFSSHLTVHRLAQPDDSDKNCGLFFKDSVANLYADNELSGNKTTAEIAAILDQTWVCGENQYPGGCDPTYSGRFAVQTTINRGQGFDKTKPAIAGFIDCGYTLT